MSGLAPCYRFLRKVPGRRYFFIPCFRVTTLRAMCQKRPEVGLMKSFLATIIIFCYILYCCLPDIFL